MAKFRELNNNINEIIMKLTESQDLCKLLYYQSDNPLSEPDIEDTFGALFMTNIFPIPKIPTTITEPKSYVTILFDDIRIGTRNIGFKNSVLSFNVFCHIDKWKMNGALRPYSIMNQIDELFNNQKVVGIGKVQFDSSRSFAVNEKYFGFHMEYVVTDFN